MVKPFVLRSKLPSHQNTSVDDTRNARRELEARFHSDIDELCDHAHRVSLRYAKKLGIKLAKPVSAGRRVPTLIGPASSAAHRTARQLRNERRIAKADC